MWVIRHRRVRRQCHTRSEMVSKRTLPERVGTVKWLHFLAHRSVLPCRGLVLTNYGRSHHQRQREALDCHAFTNNRREECVQMPAKIARSSPRRLFALDQTSLLSCRKAAKARIFTSDRKPMGNPGYKSFATSRARLAGFVVGAKRARTVPALSTKNFVKFHFMSLPSSPPCCSLSQT